MMGVVTVDDPHRPPLETVRDATRWVET